MSTYEYDDPISGSTYAFEYDDSDGSSPKMDDINAAIKNAQSMESTKNNQPAIKENADSQRSIPERLMRGAYENVKGALTTAFNIATPGPMLYQGAKELYNVATSEKTLGQGASDWLQQRLPVQGAVGLYQGANKAIDYVSQKRGTGVEGLVQTGKDIGNWMIDNPVDTAMMLIPGAKKIPGVGKVTKAIGEMVTTAPDIKLQQIVREGFAKGIGGTKGTAKTYRDIQNYDANAVKTVKSIVENKAGLEILDEAGEPISLPKTRREFSQAIDQRQKQVYQQYNAAMEQTNGIGVQISLEPAAQEIEQVLGNRVLQDMRSEVIQRAQETVEKLRNRGSYSIAETQEAIELANKSTEAYYKTPSVENGTIAHIDAKVARYLREAADAEITSNTGVEYQALKNEYGAMTAVRKDVARAAAKDAHLKIKPGQDLIDVIAGAEFLTGLFTGNPAWMIAGGGAKAFGMWAKKMREPNRYIKNMFQRADKVIGGGTEGRPVPTPAIYPALDIAPREKENEGSLYR